MANILVPNVKDFCYYCKLLDDNTATAFAPGGFSDWPNIHISLAEHENFRKCLQAMVNFCELQQRLSVGNEVQEQLIKHEKIGITFLSDR